MKAGRLLVALALVAGAVLGVPGIANAGPGDLDSRFGAWRQFGAPLCGHQRSILQGVERFGEAQQLPVLQQSNGQLIQLADEGGSFGVTRLRSTGAVDPTYAVHPGESAGIEYLDVADWEFAGAALGPVDELVVALMVDDDTYLYRLTSAGLLDPTFGDDGLVVLDAPVAGDVVVQSDGKPLVMIGTGTGPRFSSVVRLLTDGDVDSGYTFVNPAPEVPIDLHTMAIDASDRVLLGGNGTAFAYRIGRWNTDGGRDGSFLIEESTAGGAGDLNDVEVLRSGRILAGTTVNLENPRRSDLGLLRYLIDGSPDITFAGDGSMTHSVGRWDLFTTMREAGNRDVFVLGSFPYGQRADFGVSLTRVRPDGTPDESFGRSGHTAVESDSPYPPNGLATFRDYVIVVASHTMWGYRNYVDDRWTELMRFRTDTTPLGTGLVLASSGMVRPFGPAGSPAPCVSDDQFWYPFDAARGLAVVPGYGGYILDGSGTLRTFSLGVRPKPPRAQGGPHWITDFARGVAARSSGKGGYIVDASGGLHGFTTAGNPMPTRTRGGPSWPGADLARGVALLPSGTGGYVLDAYGALHPFAVGTNPMPPPVHGNLVTPGWDIARGVGILPGGAGGYVVDAANNLHPFGIGAGAVPPPLTSAAISSPGLPPIQPRGLAFVSPLPAPPVDTNRAASAPPQPFLPLLSSSDEIIPVRG